MFTRLALRRLPVLFLGGAIVVGCGGGGSTAGGGSKSPSAKTVADASATLRANGMSLLCVSFTDFGRRIVGPGSRYFDIPLGLYVTDLVNAVGVHHNYFVDSARTQTAGTFVLASNDAAQSASGPFSITAGTYAGLTGTYFDAVQTGGIEGSITFNFPDGSSQVSQFVQKVSGGVEYLEATVGFAGASGYTQTQQASYPVGGGVSTTSLDSNKVRAALSFNTDFSGSGTLNGNDPGLPASVTWDSQGNGQVKFADGSVHTLTAWALS